MARIYSSKSPLESIVSGAFEGLDYVNKRKDREEDVRLDKASKRGQLEALALKDFKGYRKPEYDDEGLFQRFAENEEAKARNRPLQEKLAPQYFERILQGAKDAETRDLDSPTMSATPRQELTPSGRPITTYDEVGSTPQAGAVPSQPTPLLKDPNKEKLLAQTANEVIKAKGAAAQADAIVPGEKSYVGKSPEGKDTYVQNAAKTKVSFDDGVNIAGSPAAPEVKEEYNPTPEMLAAIDDRITGPAAKDSDRLIPVSSIPQALQRELGIEGMREIPASVFNGLLQYKKGANKPGVTSQLNEATYELIGQVENGMPVGTAMRMLAERQGSAPLPQQATALRDAANRYARGQSRDAQAVTRSEARSDKQEERLDKSVERFQKAYANTGVLDALPFLQQIERETGVITGTNENKKKLPGTATNIVRSLPLIGNSAALAMAKSYKGGATAQALQGLLNAQIKNLSGAAVSSYEQGRNLVQAGMAPGGSEEDVARGIQLMLQGFKEADTSVRAAFDPAVINTYERRGGQVPVIDEVLRKEGKSREKKSSSGKKDVGNMRDIMAAATAKMKELDARTDINASQKRAFKKEVADRFESLTGVPWGRKDGTDVP